MSAKQRARNLEEEQLLPSVGDFTDVLNEQYQRFVLEKSRAATLSLIGAKARKTPRAPLGARFVGKRLVFDNEVAFHQALDKWRHRPLPSTLTPDACLPSQGLPIGPTRPAIGCTTPGCKKFFKTWVKLLEHRLQNHTQNFRTGEVDVAELHKLQRQLAQANQHKCDECDYSFPSLEKLDEHKQTHAILDFYCLHVEEVGAGQENESSLGRSQRGDGAGAANNSSHAVDMDEELRRQRQIEEGGQTRRMKMCNRKFATKRDLMDHMKVVHGIYRARNRKLERADGTSVQMPNEECAYCGEDCMTARLRSYHELHVHRGVGAERDKPIRRRVKIICPVCVLFKNTRRAVIKQHIRDHHHAFFVHRTKMHVDSMRFRLRQRNQGISTSTTNSAQANQASNDSDNEDAARHDDHVVDIALAGQDFLFLTLSEEECAQFDFIMSPVAKRQHRLLREAQQSSTRRMWYEQIERRVLSRRKRRKDNESDESSSDEEESDSSDEEESDSSDEEESGSSDEEESDSSDEEESGSSDEEESDSSDEEESGSSDEEESGSSDEEESDSSGEEESDSA